MMTPLRYAIALLATYLLAWTLSYASMFVARGDGLDFTYFFEYFALAWTFRAGEVPSFIWLFSVAAFLPLTVLVIYLLRRQPRGGRALGATSGGGTRHI